MDCYYEGILRARAKRPDRGRDLNPPAGCRGVGGKVLQGALSMPFDTVMTSLIAAESNKCQCCVGSVCRRKRLYRRLVFVFTLLKSRMFTDGVTRALYNKTEFGLYPPQVRHA